MMQIHVVLDDPTNRHDDFLLPLLTSQQHIRKSLHHHDDTTTTTTTTTRSVSPDNDFLTALHRPTSTLPSHACSWNDSNRTLPTSNRSATSTSIANSRIMSRPRLEDARQDLLLRVLASSMHTTNNERPSSATHQSDWQELEDLRERLRVRHTKPKQKQLPLQAPPRRVRFGSVTIQEISAHLDDTPHRPHWLPTNLDVYHGMTGGGRRQQRLLLQQQQQQSEWKTKTTSSRCRSPTRRRWGGRLNHNDNKNNSTDTNSHSTTDSSNTTYQPKDHDERQDKRQQFAGWFKDTQTPFRVTGAAVAPMPSMELTTDGGNGVK